jgi:hypothetical protein
MRYAVDIFVVIPFDNSQLYLAGHFNVASDLCCSERLAPDARDLISAQYTSTRALLEASTKIAGKSPMPTLGLRRSVEN